MRALVLHNAGILHHQTNVGLQDIGEQHLYRQSIRLLVGGFAVCQSLLFLFGFRASAQLAIIRAGFFLGVTSGLSTFTPKSSGGFIGDVFPTDVSVVPFFNPCLVLIVILHGAARAIGQAFPDFFEGFAGIYIVNFKFDSHGFFLLGRTCALPIFILINVWHVRVKRIVRFFAVSVTFGFEHFNRVVAGGFFCFAFNLPDFDFLAVDDLALLLTGSA